MTDAGDYALRGAKQAQGTLGITASETTGPGHTGICSKEMTRLALASADIPDLTCPDEFSDIVLLVEEKNLYTCRGILASASPVWRKIFISDFREREAETIPLPGKVFSDVHEMLLCISPAIQKPITSENVLSVLPLADEYQMAKLKSDCEMWLMQQMECLPPEDECLKFLSLAEKYSLDRLLDKSVGIVSDMSYKQVEKHPDFAQLSKDTIIQLLKTRVGNIESANSKLQRSNDSWRSKCEELEDILKKMGREKLTIKYTLDEIESAWETKNSDARCIDPVHIYGPRNYACEKCTRQVRTYMQAKVWYLLNRGSTWSGISWP